MISIQACSWLPLPPCLPSFVSLHDLHSGLLLAAAAALSPFICLPAWSPFRPALGCRCRLVSLHLSPCMISIQACSWLPLPPCLPSFVSLHDLHSGLLLAAAAALSPFICLPAWSPFRPALGCRCRLVSLHLSPCMISIQACSWLPLPPCLPSFVSLHDLHSGLLLAAAAALSPFICLPAWSPFWPALGCRLVSLHESTYPVKPGALMASILAVCLRVHAAWLFLCADPAAALWHLPSTIPDLRAVLTEQQLHGFLDRLSQVPRRVLPGLSQPLNGYSIAHSGSPADPFGGLLVMVHHRLGKADDISLVEPLADSLKLKTTQLDPWPCECVPASWWHTMTHDENLSTRLGVWETLHESLTHLPFCNRLILAGDFNTSIISSAHADAFELRQIIQHHNLGSLLQSQKDKPTYYSQQGNSQIDFVFGRQCQLDSKAKTGIVDLQTPLASWREVPDHRPLICSMPLDWYPWRRKPQGVQSSVQLRDHLKEHAQQGSSNWQLLCQQIQTDIEAMPHNPELIESLQTLMLSRIAMIPLKQMMTKRGLAPGSLLGWMWSIHKQAFDGNLPLCQIFFKLGDGAQKCRDFANNWDRFAERTVEERIQEAIIAAFKCHDPYHMYKVVRTLAPKTPFRTVPLRSPFGLEQDPHTELQELAAFFAELCKGTEIVFPAKALQQMPFTCDELQRSLAGTPSTKSVAPGTCPGLVIKSLAETLVATTVVPDRTTTDPSTVEECLDYVCS